MNWKDISILIVDPDLPSRQMIAGSFADAGANVVTAEAIDTALETFTNVQPDLVILDLFLPEAEGLELCRQLRRLSTAPILMLAEIERYDLIFKSLEAGADDYLAKPLENQELLVRCWAVWRRALALREAAEQTGYDDGYLVVDLANQLVSLDGTPIKVTGTEFALLAYLIKHNGQICTFEELLFNVWGPEYQKNSQYIHVFIWHLRQKLERNPKDPRYLISVHSLGYRFQGRKSR